MNTNDKREDILQKIKDTTDEKLIEEVYQLLNQKESIEEVMIKTLPPELKEKIHRALDDYKNGRYITHEQMKKKVDQWLTK
ncbi:MAG TPA: hypothetical protein VFT78_12700 [Hanamia sp.]|jgi:hypothetical protein|nr:hypothetical protein [Hanamia sp.]